MEMLELEEDQVVWIPFLDKHKTRLLSLQDLLKMDLILAKSQRLELQSLEYQEWFLGMLQVWAM